MLDLFSSIMQAFHGFSSMTEPMKVAAVLTALISIWKSSILHPYWQKVGWGQVLVAPVLGVLLAIAQLPDGFSWASIVVGFKTGLLSVALHELISAIEGLPFIGPKWQTWLSLVDGLLAKPQPQQAPADQ